MPFTREDKTPEGEKIFRKKTGQKIKGRQKWLGLYILFAMADALHHNNQQHSTERNCRVDPVHAHKRIYGAERAGDKYGCGNEMQNQIQPVCMIFGVTGILPAG